LASDSADIDDPAETRLPSSHRQPSLRQVATAEEDMEMGNAAPLTLGHCEVLEG
jgi:hypothetical protein